ncbi:phage tail tube protein [Kitasatospora sp. NPDC003701]
MPTPDLTKDTLRVATTGTLYIAPPMTPMPNLTGAQFADPAGWTTLGLFSEDGVEHSFSEDTEDIKSWQAGVVRTLVTGRDLTLKFSALESRPAVLESFYGLAPGSIKSADGKSVRFEIKAAEKRKPFAALFVLHDGESMWALHMDKAQVSEVESPKFTNSEAISWGMTAKALGVDANTPLGTWEIHDADIAALASGGTPPSGQ